MHSSTDTHSMVENRRTKRKAIAPGAIKRAIAKISPAAARVATMVNEISAN